MRVYLCGQKAFGAAALEAVRQAGHEILGVSAPLWSESEPERPDRLRAAADLARVPFLPAGMLCADRLPAGTDVIVAAHSHDFIGRATRLRARIGAIGYHPSLLPRHRGRDAIRWTIRLRDPVAGGTVYWLSDNVDAGDIAAQPVEGIEVQHPQQPVQHRLVDLRRPEGGGQLRLQHRAVGGVMAEGGVEPAIGQIGVARFD